MHVRTVVVVVLYSGTVAFLLCLTIAENIVKELNVEINEETQNSVNENFTSYNGNIKQILDKRCSYHYNGQCFKYDLVRLVDRLDKNTNFQILPGVSVVRTPSTDTVLSTESLLSKSEDYLDNYLNTRFRNYLKSLSLNIKILDNNVAKTAKSLGNKIFGPDPELTATARRRNRFGHYMATAGLMSGATFLAVGMSALAAMAGKALMTSLLSLMLSALSALKFHGDGGGGHKSTTYEIVAKPIVSHMHTHSSEVQHMTGHGGHSHDGGYGYARSMASTPVQPIMNKEIYQTDSTYLSNNNKLPDITYDIRQISSYFSTSPEPSLYSSPYYSSVVNISTTTPTTEKSSDS